MAEPGVLVQHELEPYRPGWVNRWVAWVERLPLPYWVYYLGLAIAIVGVQNWIKWYDGTLPPGSFFLPLILFSCAGVYALALMHSLIRRVPETLERLRPALKGDEAAYLKLLYRLANAPALPVLLATLAGLALGAVLQSWLLRPVLPIFKLSVTPTSTVFDGTLFILTWGVLGAGLYSLLHFLRGISQIYLEHTEVNLFQPQPLYSLSGLASRAALGVALYNLPWITLTPGASNVPAIVVLTLIFQFMAAAVFFVPLLGVHQLLLEDKYRRQQIVGKKLQYVLEQIHQKMDSGDASGIDPLQKLLSLLQTEQSTLEKAPTWPWNPETMRLVITAIGVPMLVWLIQRALNRFGL
ncbi:MAG TPA: hypothetical protein VFS50_12875 [Meiothermus sp.]|nr:hypothetical protein [Meiothermus sp.]